LLVILIMPSYIDQLNKEIILKKPPVRIISLVPSQTELLYDLGLADKVVGITKFCVHPDEWFRSKTRVGGTKNIHISKVQELQPDLIIANKEENLPEQVTELETIAPVWTSDISTVDDALRMIYSIGEITDRKEPAEMIIEKISTSFAEIRKMTELHQKIRTVYLIWKDPYMTVGGDTFIHEIMTLAGLQNVFADSKRYPEIHLEDIPSAGAELVLLSSEPYPFKEKHITALSQQLPGARIMLVDGQIFSWYGSRMLHIAEYLRNFFKNMQQGNR
jgi:ABC-type Fe3+-hydroxamate transport system substrate-binding protein